ncbi:PurR Transcriptional regulators [Rhabdaerophilaceae bacterium]
MKQTAPTLKMIAAHAGVHVSTASRALDPARRHLIADEVVRHISETASKLGYRRNVGAAALRTGRSRLIGVLLPDLANPVFGPILRGVEEALADEGYAAIVANAGGTRGKALAAAEHLLARRVEALVSASAELLDPVVSLCLEAKTPLVLVNRAETRLRTGSVISDDKTGIGLAVDYLASLGHRKIGHIAGPQNVSTGLWRRDGFVEAMSRLGLAEGPVVVASAYSRQSGAEAARALFVQSCSVTGIAVANDLLALGAYAVLAEFGLRCPEDISIIGYNDMPLMDLVEPPLSTVQINPEELGRRAGHQVIAAIRAGGQAPHIDILKPTLVIRRSAAPAPGCDRLPAYQNGQNVCSDLVFNVPARQTALHDTRTEPPA